MASATRRAPRRPRKPVWERGYRSHGFWRGNEKLGTVRLADARDSRGRYVWLAGTQTGLATTLREAKRAVEAVVFSGGRQLSLPLSLEDTANPPSW